MILSYNDIVASDVEVGEIVYIPATPVYDEEGNITQAPVAQPRPTVRKLELTSNEYIESNFLKSRVQNGRNIDVFVNLFSVSPNAIYSKIKLDFYNQWMILSNNTDASIVHEAMRQLSLMTWGTYTYTTDAVEEVLDDQGEVITPAIPANEITDTCNDCYPWLANYLPKLLNTCKPKDVTSVPNIPDLTLNATEITLAIQPFIRYGTEYLFGTTREEVEPKFETFLQERIKETRDRTRYHGFQFKGHQFSADRIVQGDLTAIMAEYREGWHDATEPYPWKLAANEYYMFKGVEEISEFGRAMSTFIKLCFVAEGKMTNDMTHATFNDLIVFAVPELFDTNYSYDGKPVVLPEVDVPLKPATKPNVLPTTLPTSVKSSKSVK